MKNRILFVIVSGLLIVLFQNCGETPFAEVDYDSGEGDASTSTKQSRNNTRPNLQEIVPEEYSAKLVIEGTTTTVEGNQMLVDFRLTELLDHPVKFDYMLEQSSAFAGSDYVHKSGKLVIPAGSDRATIIINTLIDEDSFETSESFYIVVTGVEGEAQRPNPVKATIEEDVDQLLERGSQSSQLALGENTSCAILQFNNTEFTEAEGTLSTSNEMRCWGKQPTASSAPRNVSLPRKPIRAVGGTDFICYAGNSTLECMGSKIGTGTGKLPARPVAGYAHALAAGTQHACAIIGTDRKLHCWGINNNGQTGSSSMGTNVKTPGSNVLSFRVGPDVITEKVQAVAAGSNHTCAIVKGALFCWGLNDRNQLGNGKDGEKYATPQPVYGMSSGVTAVSAGRKHTCAVKNDTVYCWGDNQLGQMGNGDTSAKQAIPFPVIKMDNFKGIRRLVSGNDHNCVMGYGKVSCWGDSEYGQVGGGRSKVVVTSPDAITNGLSGYVSDISAGGNHTCAIYKASAGSATSQVACWGRANHNQSGGSNEPTPMYGLEVLAHYNSEAAQKTQIEADDIVVGGGAGSPFTSGGGFGTKN